MARRRAASPALVIDEVGLATTRYSDYRLKSAFQPLFRRSGDLMVPFAVEALVAPFIDGTALPAAKFFEAVAAEHRVAVESACRALHIQNFRHIEPTGLDLFFNFDPSANGDPARAVREIRKLGRLIATANIDPRRLICEITEAEQPDAAALTRAAEELRRRCLRIAIDDYGAGHSTPARVESIRPDFVKIDGKWFGRAATDRFAVRRLGRLFTAMRAAGAMVLVEGIESRELLVAAMEAGADCFQGYLLARPAIAGTAVQRQSIATRTLIAA